MRYLIAALMAVLLLTSSGAARVGAGGLPGVSGPGDTVNPPPTNTGDNEDTPDQTQPSEAVFIGNIIVQTNDQSALASESGSSVQRAANWAVAAGDDNRLYQTNILPLQVSGMGMIYQNSTNLGLLIGTGDEAHQFNDPTSSLSQMNEVIILGFYNYANQSNYASADARNATVYQKQNSFGLIFGNNSTLLQSNMAEAYNYGDEVASINQTQANAAYLYGFENRINQTNIDSATIDANSTASIDQTAKNLAFAISSCCSPKFIPVCENYSMEGECPEVPGTPPASPEYPLTDYPLDP
jgi:hypothetical protein